jgi:hypothetical protein
MPALVGELFPDGAHPWAVSFSQFIEEHHAEPAVRGETSDGIAFVYYPRSNRGIWFEHTGKALGWVCSAKPASRRFPKSSRKPDISDLNERKL